MPRVMNGTGAGEPGPLRGVILDWGPQISTEADLEMDIDALAVARSSPEVRQRMARSRLSNHSNRVAGLDGRSSIMRRRRDLVAAYAAELSGNISDAKRVEIGRAADLVLAAEVLRARVLRGEDVDLFHLVRLENLSLRALWALGLTRRRRPDLGPTEDPLDYAKRFREEPAGA